MSTDLLRTENAALKQRIAALEAIISCAAIRVPPVCNDKPLTALALKIIDAVCLGYGISPAEIKNRSRNNATVWPRHVAFYLLRKVCKMGFQNIADLFAKDHGTVMNGALRVESLMAVNVHIRNEVHGWETSLTEDLQSLKAEP